MGVPAHRCAGGEKRRSSRGCSGATVSRAGRVAVKRHSARWLVSKSSPPELKLGNSCQRSGAVPVAAIASQWRAIGIRSNKINNRVGGLVTPQGIGCGGQPTSIGGAGQPNKPINANWQAAFLLELAGPVKVARLRLAVAHLANRVIGRALGCCRRGWKRKRAGFEVGGCTGSPLRRWGEAAAFGGMFRRNRAPGWSGRGEKAQRPLVG